MFTAHHSGVLLLFLILWSVLKAEKVESAYESLQQKTTDVYIQRARQLYTVAPQRTGLFLWTLNDVNIIALADPSHHGYDNVVQVMREIDPSRSVSLIHLHLCI